MGAGQGKSKRAKSSAGGAVIERPRLDGPGTGYDDAWRVIVLNDSHNTFDGVIQALSQVIPGMTPEKASKIANGIHNTGQAIVWSGHLEIAEHYWEQLKDRGLTMAKLEK